MRAAPLRFLSAALWPLSIWSSLTHLEEHPADDYVERTSPIVATAVGFWLCAAVLTTLLVGGGTVFTIFGEADSVEAVRGAPHEAVSALWVVMPVLYVIGFWLFTKREERYRG